MTLRPLLLISIAVLALSACVPATSGGNNTPNQPTTGADEEAGGPVG